MRTEHTEPAGLSDEAGMIPMEYVDVDSDARIVCEPSEDRPSTGCWAVLNSRHISPFKEFHTAEAAYHALRAAIAADRAQRQPVPVSERLPGPEDMTDDGEVWIEDPGHEYPLADAGDYDWEPHKWILRPIGKFDAQNGLRWLPAHALPLPGEVER